MLLLCYYLEFAFLILVRHLIEHQFFILLLFLPFAFKTEVSILYSVLVLKYFPKTKCCQKWDLNPRLLSKTRILYNRDHPASCWLESGALDRSAILTCQFRWLNEIHKISAWLFKSHIWQVYFVVRRNSRFRLRTLILLQLYKKSICSKQQHSP